MKAKTKAEIRELLESYHNLSECVIENINWKDYGTTVEVIFDYIWTDDGRVRPKPDRPENITLTFRLVQEFHMHNYLNATMCAQPGELGWGLNEVAVATVGDDVHDQYRFLPVPFNHVAFLWEDERRIDIIFSELEILR
jgi:hypothetical protein